MTSEASGRWPQGFHGNCQDRPRRIAIEISLAHPFGRRLQEGVGRSGEFIEIANLAGDEVEGELAQFTERTRVIVVKPCFRDVTELVAAPIVIGGKHPFCEMPELGPKAGAFLVSVTPCYETLVEDLRQG